MGGGVNLLFKIFLKPQMLTWFCASHGQNKEIVANPNLSRKKEQVKVQNVFRLFVYKKLNRTKKIKKKPKKHPTTS